MHHVLTVTEDEKGKGRTFSGALFTYVCADGLWFGGEANTEIHRPVYAVLGFSTGNAYPFEANLRFGRKMELDKGQHSGGYHRREAVPRWEFLRSASYTWKRQVYPEGVVLIAYLTELFEYDPGIVDPKELRMVVLPTKQWMDQASADRDAIALRLAHVQRAGFPHRDDSAAHLAAMAPLFMARLNKRAPLPTINDDRFATQVLFAALHCGIASMTKPHDYTGYGYKNGDKSRPWGRHLLGYVEYGLGASRLSPGVTMRATHETLQGFLAEQVDHYDRITLLTDAAAKLKVLDESKATKGGKGKRTKKDSGSALATGAEE
jgi:hypothetical protein